MKKPLLFALTIITFSILIGCSVADDIKDTANALECAALIESLNDDNETCAQTISDINKIESTCGEFLTDETKEIIASFKANCQDN